MPILGRSRSLRLKEWRDESTISQPVLIGTDAAPRNDLYALSPTTVPDATSKMAPRSGSRKPTTRPRTSGGEKPQKTVRSQDESHSSRTEKQAFDFTPGSPRVYYTAEVHEDPTIGMALGSPTQAATWNRPESSFDSRTSSSTPSSANTGDPWDDKPDQKLSRWRSIFGRKAPINSPSIPFYRVEIQRLPTPLDYRTYPDQPRHVLVPKQGSLLVSDEDRKRPSPQRRGASEPVKSRITRSPSSTKKQKSPSSGYREDRSPVPPSKDNAPRIPTLTIDYAGPSPSAASTSSKPKPSGLMLDIEIPESQMERYSVMFSDVLRPDETCSLLSRRKNSNGHALKPLDEFTVNTQSANRTHLKPSRRATSPSHQSPTFAVSLFPPHEPRAIRDQSTKSHDDDPRRPLRRSQTDPVPSPARAFFSSLRPDRYKTNTTIPSPSTSLPFADVAETPLSQQSFETDDAAVLRYTPVSWKSTLTESAWDTVNRHLDQAVSPHTTAPYSRNPHQHASPKRISTHPPRASAKPSSPLSTLKELSRPPKTVDLSRTKGGTVQVGIARSVSLTKSKGLAASRKDSLGAGSNHGIEKYGERKALVPTVVQLGVAGEHRRSHRVQIESA